MKFCGVSLIILAAISAVNSAKTMPSYLKPCSRSDPKFSACASKSVKDTILALAQEGDKDMKIPPLDPMRIQRVELKGGKSMQVALTLMDLDIYGLTEAEITGVKVDFNTNEAEVNLLMKTLLTLGKYELRGKVMILPVEGSGEANITLVGIKAKVRLYFDLVKKEDGKEYMMINKSKLVLDLDRSYVHFQNLFNGDVTLGDNINAVLNDNWKEMWAELGGGVEETLAKVIQNTATHICSNFPADELFLP